MPTLPPYYAPPPTQPNTQDHFFFGILNGRFFLRGVVSVRTVGIGICILTTIMGYPTITTVFEKVLKGWP